SLHRPAPTSIYTLSLQRRSSDLANTDPEHARRTPASTHGWDSVDHPVDDGVGRIEHHHFRLVLRTAALGRHMELDRITGYQLVIDRKSTRLNSSHVKISYAVFCL